MAIKMEHHPTQQTPDYKSRNWRIEGRIQKIPQGRDYPISSTYRTHRHHPLISTRTRNKNKKQEQPPWRVGCHTLYSVKH